MQNLDDMTLVREFAARRGEAAFETLVARHSNIVYSAAPVKGGALSTAQPLSS